MELWIVGKRIPGMSWEFCGVFDDEKKAVSACLDKRYFVGPATLNALIPDESTIWRGAYYPHSKSSGSGS
jgi:hypothetical protein